MLKTDLDEQTIYKKSLEFLRKCSSKDGFLASLSDVFNYRRIWARDGVIIGLSALLSGEKDLIKTFEKTLGILAEYQGKKGQIPSNVEPVSKSVSYGMTSGRVDATLWYIIGCGQYYKYTKHKNFLKTHIKALNKAFNILESWEFNQKDFIFVPDAGDWADESPRHGYILYDQLLYYQAIHDYIFILKTLGKNADYWQKKIIRLKKKIMVNYWVDRKNIEEKYIYHHEMFYSSYKRYKGKQQFWFENFHRLTFYKRFDAFANILTILLDFSNNNQANKIFDYVSKILGAGYLVPAFYPVIDVKYKTDWKELHGNYSFYFKNRPYYAHNGGLWPMLTGFYVAALAKKGKKNLAHKYFKNIGYANYLDKKKKEDWGFYEYHHGLKRKPEGIREFAWSAAAAVIGYQTLRGKKILK